MVIRLKMILLAFCLISVSSFIFLNPIGQAQGFDTIEFLTGEIETAPDPSMLYFWRGFAYADRKQHELAVDDYTKAIESQPQLDGLYYYRGFSYVELRKYDLALQDYNKAIALDPKNPVYYSECGYVQWKLNNFPQSIIEFTKAIELDPTANYYNGRGNAYGCMGKYSEASEDLEKALQLDQKDGTVYFNLAQVYEKLGQKERALLHYRRADKIGIQNLQDTSRTKVTDRLHGEWDTFAEWL